MASIRCAHCKNTHSSVSEVRECALDNGVGSAHYEHGSASADWDAVTEAAKRENVHRVLEGSLFCGHRDKAGDLCGESVELTADNEPTHEARLINLEHDVLAVSAGQLARLRAGLSVDGMQLKTTQERREQRVQEPVDEGWYKVDDTIYKVQLAVHGSGRPYAKELVLEELLQEEKIELGIADLVATSHRGRWEYAPGAIKRLRPEHKLSIEEAAEYGKLYGVCVRCARTLTKEESIARGMGDVCAGKGF